MRDLLIAGAEASGADDVEVLAVMAGLAGAGGWLLGNGVAADGIGVTARLRSSSPSTDMASSGGPWECEEMCVCVCVFIFRILTMRKRPPTDPHTHSA